MNISSLDPSMGRSQHGGIVWSALPDAAVVEPRTGRSHRRRFDAL
jgi:hypothetical protein